MPPKLHQLQNVIAHEGPIDSMTLGHRTAQVFATGGDDRFLHLWSVGSNNPRASFGPFQSSITACRFNENEEKIACGNNGGTVMLFDLNESRCVSNWTAHHSAVRGLSFHSQNPKLILTCGVDGKFKIVSSSQRTPLQCYNAHNGPVNWVSCSGDGRYAATCGEDKTVRVFDITAQRQLIKFEGHTDSVTCVEFHPTEPFLISCGEDRSIRFWDLTASKEIPVSFPLDSSPVDIVMYAPGENAALSASADYIKVVGWNPPEFFDHFTLGLERVHDLAVVDNMLTIASTSNDRALIHRMRLNQLKPFSSRPAQAAQFTSDQNKPRPTTPRLLDISAMPKVKPAKVAGAKKNVDKRNSPPENNRQISSKSSASSSKSSSRNSKRGTSAPQPPLSSGNSGNDDDSNLTEEQRTFKEFRKSRGSFMSSMNEKFSRLTRVKDMLMQFGLTKTLESAAESGDLGLELLVILRMKPEVIKLEHSALMMQIAVRIFDRDYDLAITTVESMLQAYGKLVNATRQMASSGVGIDVALEERKKKSEIFVESFREIAPKLRTVSCGKSTASQTAAELLDEWRIFLR
ncbi:hypothetical protein TRFO_01590 [Tritrichomonas foetus]|uniref:Katanin p80 subunit C-terminal domain-containing protein n=1 Tax=Tritrichomonas foetus TaxID=1144522 RepID=A0A1J4K296_9EUKA|nr:hypothetical protein TRFO_01590 [Tritrichomonas foetus]|eukprot:OHT03862.1 hypothetical protein TRFO_01590 [Tritrichomonas foetus]